MGLFDFFSSQKKTQKQPQRSEVQFQLDLFSNLNETQKYAMLTMLGSLAAAPASAERTEVVQRMMFTDAAMMGITQNMMLNYMQTHTKTDSQTMISTLRTITDSNILEWLIYSGFGIVAVNQNEKACYVFFVARKQLGYESEEIYSIVNRINTMGDEMRKFNNI